MPPPGSCATVPPVQAARAAAVMATGLLGGCSPLLYVLVGGGDDGIVGTIGVGQIVSSTTEDDDDHWEARCADPRGAGDEVWTFVAPTTGQYRVRVDASYDSVVSVRRDGPSGEEIACNDDAGGTAMSEVLVRLEAQGRYAILVDGYRESMGAYRLRVTQETQDLLPQEIPGASGAAYVRQDAAGMEARCEQAPPLREGTTRGEVTAETGTALLQCGAGGRGGDVVYRVEVAAPATFEVRASSVFDAVLELRDGCGAGARVIACVDDAPDVHNTGITTHLDPGAYFLIVDSYEAGTGGPFTLEMRLVPDAGGALTREE